MSNRSLIAALAVLLLAAGAWYLIVIRGVGRTPAEPVQPPVVEATPEPSPIQPVPQDPLLNEPAVASPQRAQQVIAMTFAERYGTYSTDAAFANLKRLSSLTTPVFASVLETQAAGATPGTGGFYSVTTKALSGEVTLTTDTSAVVKVTTQRQEVFARGGEQRLSYQVLTVTLERQGEQWLVAGARWEK